MKKSYKIIRTSRGLIHAMAYCDCGWEEGDYLIASKEATKHVDLTGHVVTVEKGTVEKIQRIPF